MKKSRRGLANPIAAIVIVVVLVAAAGAGYYVSSLTASKVITNTIVTTVTVQGNSNGSSTVPNATQAFTPSAQLVAEAKSEGSLSVYSPIPTSVFNQFYWPSFTKLYPWAKLNFFSSDVATVYSKSLSEYQAGKVQADIIVNNFNYMVLDKVNSVTAPYNFTAVPSYYPPAAYDPQGYWYAYASIPVVVLYNKNLVSPSQVPHSWFDLTNSTWSGKIGYDDPPKLDAFGGSLATLSTVFGTNELKSYMTAIAATSPKYYATSGDLFSAISTGQIDLGLGNYQDILQNPNDTSVQASWLNPTIWIPATIGIANKAPDPAMAQLFMLWWLSPAGATINAFGDGVISTASFQNIPNAGLIPGNVTLMRMYQGVNPDPDINPTFWQNFEDSTLGYTGS